MCFQHYTTAQSVCKHTPHVWGPETHGRNMWRLSEEHVPSSNGTFCVVQKQFWLCPVVFHLHCFKAEPALVFWLLSVWTSGVHLFCSKCLLGLFVPTVRMRLIHLKSRFCRVVQLSLILMCTISHTVTRKVQIWPWCQIQFVLVTCLRLKPVGYDPCGVQF